MESSAVEERRPHLPAANSLKSGFMVNGPTTQNIGDVHFNNSREQRPPTLKESLFFQEMASRERSVADTHRRTGRWFLRTNQYLEWEPGEKPTPKSRPSCGMLPAPTGRPRERWQSRLLWVKGNAGAGKSTLMKMAVEHAKKTYKGTLILPHFFNARGTRLERSVEGMYRTLISWLLEQLPEELESVLAPRGRQFTNTKWEVPELIRLLRRAVGHAASSCVLFFIDALDECDRQEVRDMLDVFRALVEDTWESGRDVRVCFASRPYPHHTFQQATYLDLGEQEEHKKDIAEYIRDCLLDGISESIHKKVLEKAAGVFMWTVLVVRMLNEKHDAGDAGGMEALVSSIPGGLYELYSHILERHPGDDEEMLECFRWLLSGSLSLSPFPRQLWWAIQLSLGRSDDEIRQGYDSMDEEGMMRYIMHVGKGLVEFKGYVDGQNRKVKFAQFIHESAREFILHKGGEVLRMYGMQNRDDLAAQSHVRLRDCFLNEVMARRPQYLEAVETEGRDGEPLSVLSRLSTQFPTVLSVTSEMILQAESAQRCGVDQTEFVNTVLPHGGPLSFIWFDESSSRLMMLDSVVGLLVSQGCPELIRHTQREAARRAIQSRQPFGLIDEGSGISPISVALIYGHDLQSVDPLLELYLESEPRHPQLQQILQHLAHIYYRKDNKGFYHYLPQIGPFLGLSQAFPAVATFFLIALASPGILEPHLDDLQCIIDRFPLRPFPRLAFSHILLLFVQAQLPSTAIDLMHPDTLRWLMQLERKGGESDEEESDEEESDEEESDEEESDEEEERDIRQRIMAELRTRREDTDHGHNIT